MQQRDAGALQRDVGAGAHRDPDVGLGQRRRVVDAVAGHRHLAPLRLQARDGGRLAVRQHLGDDLVDADRLPDRLVRVARASPVSMTTRRPSARRAARVSRAPGFTASAIASAPASPPSTATNTTVCPGCCALRAARLPAAALDPQLREQALIADGHGAAVRPDPAARVPPAPETSVGARPRPDRAPPRPPRSPAPAGARWPAPAHAASRSTSVSACPGAAATHARRGRPSVSVPVLSTSSVSTCLQRLQRLGVAEQHARRRRRARWRP